MPFYTLCLQVSHLLLDFVSEVHQLNVTGFAGWALFASLHQFSPETVISNDLFFIYVYRKMPRQEKAEDINDPFAVLPKV